MKSKLNIILLSAIIVATASCKKNKDAHVPPDVVFKTGTGYTSTDVTLTTNDTILVGIVATKTEDDLKSYNVSYAYDGSTTTTTFYNYYMTSNEYTSYSHDVQIITRSVPGSEKWSFSIVDRDGNITQKSITLTVQ